MYSLTLTVPFMEEKSLIKTYKLFNTKYFYLEKHVFFCFNNSVYTHEFKVYILFLESSYSNSTF